MLSDSTLSQKWKKIKGRGERGWDEKPHFFVVERVKGRGGRKSETRRNYGGQCTLTAETQ